MGGRFEGRKGGLWKGQELRENLIVAVVLLFSSCSAKVVG